jgi:hypothetical protein
MRHLFAVLLAGCYAPSVPTGALCESTEQCPAGQDCIDGRGGGGGDAPNVDPSDAPEPDCWNAWRSGNLALTEPKRIEELVGGLGIATHNPALSPDLKTIYFARTNGSNLDIFYATRLSPTDPFSPPEKVAGIQSGNDESKMSVGAPDDEIAVFSTTRLGGPGAVDLWQAHRAGQHRYNNETPLPLAAVNDAGSQFDPELTPDALHLFYAPNGGVAQRIKHASRSAITEPFGPPEDVAIDGVTTSFDPTVSPDRRVLVFTADVELDLVYTIREDPDGPFGMPRPVPGVNSSAFDGDADLASDGCSIVFITARNGLREIFAANVVR